MKTNFNSKIWGQIIFVSCAVVFSASANAQVSIRISQASSDCEGSHVHIGNNRSDIIPARPNSEIRIADGKLSSIVLNLKSPADDRIFQSTEHTTDFIYVFPGTKGYGTLGPIVGGRLNEKIVGRGGYTPNIPGAIFRMDEHDWTSKRYRTTLVSQIMECKLTMVLSNEVSSVEVKLHTYLLPKSWNMDFVPQDDLVTIRADKYVKPFGMIDKTEVLIQGTQLALPLPVVVPNQFEPNLGKKFGTYRIAIWHDKYRPNVWKHNSGMELRLMTAGVHKKFMNLDMQRYVCEVEAGIEEADSRNNFLPVFDINNCVPNY